jgi:hypothetical protein
MKKTLAIPALISIVMVSCRPKPIDIDIPQSKKAVTISSIAYDQHSAYISASYSISSMLAHGDTSMNFVDKMPADMLIDSALVLLTNENSTDTLYKIKPGVFGSRNLDLKYGQKYTLVLHDYKERTTVNAITTFLPKPVIKDISIQLSENATDTLTSIRVSIADATSESKYFVSYSTTRQLREGSKGEVKDLSAAHSFEPKRLQLFSGADADNGVLTKSFTCKAHKSDTLIVHVGNIDNAHYKYLEVYKKTGYLINQLSGEPINLPTNINTGFGYFSLHQLTSKVLVVY